MIDSLWLWVILAGLANYKVSHMITQPGDDGPFDVFKRFRDWVGETSWIGKGFHCLSCTSFWGGLVAALLIGIGLPVNLFLIAWGAIATIAFIIWRYFG